uniref:YAP binding domain-containing protein n=1 Tax=Acrobeloides nanus TaxID=290746 RepID=A0A914D0D4_9BILA
MIEETEIVWPPELENALIEAMLLYPHRTIKHADGKCYELKNGSSLDCMPLALIDNRVILTEKELDLRSQFDFAQANNIINYLRLGIPERTVSSTKLSYLYDCTYSISSSHDKKSIFTIFTSATPSYIPEIKLSVIQPFFDSTLTDLFSSVPLNSFYLIYSWVNLDFDLESKLFFQETVFYSPLKMEIDNMFVNYLFGKKFSYKYE